MVDEEVAVDLARLKPAQQRQRLKVMIPEREWGCWEGYGRDLHMIRGSGFRWLASASEHVLLQ